MLFFKSWRVSSHIEGTTLTLQLFKNSNDTQEKLRLNLHSLSVSELLKYRRLSHVQMSYQSRTQAPVQK